MANRLGFIQEYFIQMENSEYLENVYRSANYYNYTNIAIQLDIKKLF